MNNHTSMNPYGPLWFSMVHYCPYCLLWTHRVIFGHLRSFRILKSIIWFWTVPFGHLWSFMIDARSEMSTETCQEWHISLPCPVCQVKSDNSRVTSYKSRVKSQEWKIETFHEWQVKSGMSLLVLTGYNLVIKIGYLTLTLLDL